MLNQEGGKLHRTALPLDGVALAGFDGMPRQDRRIVAAFGRDEAIGKPRHDVFGGRLIEVDGNAPALVQHDRAQIVDAVGLVGVLMGQEHRIDVIDIGVDQLLAQIGRGVDHDPRGAVRARALDQQRAAAAAVFRIVGIAGAPAERRARHAGGGTAAEDRQRQRHAALSARHLGEQAEEVFRRLPRNLLQRDAARFRQHFCDFDHVGRLVALAAKFAGREIRRSRFRP